MSEEKGKYKTRPTTFSQQVSEMGKVQPQAIDLEIGVLGAILQDSGVMPVICDILRPESFYDENNGKIYSSCLSLYKKGITPDILSVSSDLKAKGEIENIGGAYAVAKLTHNESRNPEHNARIIQQAFILREYIRICSETIRLAYENSADCFDVADVLEKGITNISKEFSVGKISTMKSLWEAVVEKNKIILSNNGVSGVPTGYNEIDKITGGLQEPDLIIMAGRPSMGKTSLACCMARNASVTYGMAGVIFSLEMSALQIAVRMFSLESSVSNTTFSRNGIHPDQMIEVDKDCQKLINSNIFVDDTAAIDLMQLRSKARKLIREKNIKWIVVDYLQLMSGDRAEKQNREQQVSSISRGLKQLAKELKVPIIALSQLSRAAETRGGDKRPQLSDLRESGAIEQDADMVMFIHRPEYYGVGAYEDNTSTEGIAEIIIAKHRNGGTGTIKLRFIDYLTKFINLEDQTSAMVANVDFTESRKENTDLPYAK